MKQFRNFTAEQKHINEIGPVGATIAGVMGLIGGYKAVKAGLKKFKGYRENRADKKARREQGFDMKVKVYNPETGKDEDQEFYIDPDTGNKDLEKLTGGKFPEKTLTGKIKAPTDDDLDKMEKEANRNARRKNAEIRRKINKGEINSNSDEKEIRGPVLLSKVEKNIRGILRKLMPGESYKYSDNRGLERFITLCESSMKERQNGGLSYANIKKNEEALRLSNALMLELRRNTTIVKK